jgi:hypothetical protein
MAHSIRACVPRSLGGLLSPLDAMAATRAITLASTHDGGKTLDCGEMRSCAVEATAHGIN